MLVPGTKRVQIRSLGDSCVREGLTFALKRGYHHIYRKTLRSLFAGLPLNHLGVLENIDIGLIKYAEHPTGIATREPFPIKAVSVRAWVGLTGMLHHSRPN